MGNTLSRVIDLIAQGQVRVSEHGYDELAADALLVSDLVGGVFDARLVEDYPDYPKGPCVLVLQTDRDGMAVHVVWGVPRGEAGPAVLVTAYRPAPERWTDGFTRRRE